MKRVLLAGTFDTKAEENFYFAEQLRRNGVEAILLDLSTRNVKPYPLDYKADEVASAGGMTIDEIKSCNDRPACMQAMISGAASIVNELYQNGTVAGFAAMGGGQGTTMAMGIIRKLPLNMPKLLISTILNLDGTAAVFAGAGNAVLMNSVVDIAGLNSILRENIENGAAAISGMVKRPITEKQSKHRKRVAISMWGVTTPCVDKLRTKLENQCDVYVFHANGIGGEAMEHYAETGSFDLVIDVTIPELTMAIAGSPSPAVEGRLLRSGRSGVKRIVSVGGADMVQYYGLDQIPVDKRNRKSYCHNATVCFVRSSCGENEAFAREIANRLSQSVGEVAVALPLQGVSAVDVEGGQLYDPEADRALFDTLKQELPERIKVYEYPCAINDNAFAEGLFALASKMLEEA